MTGGLWFGPGPEHRPSQALPEWAIDKLVFGLRQDLGGGDPRKVWGECVRIAMSAYRRGWTRNEFVDEVTKCEKKKDARGRKRWMEHRLWVQLRSYNSSDRAAFKELDKAWEAAVANLNGVGMRTKEEVHDDAVERAFLWADRITDGVDALTETEASVIGYVMSETERRGMMRVTCPSRAVGEYAKVSAMTASRTLGASPRRACWSGILQDGQARSQPQGSHLGTGRPRHLPTPSHGFPGVPTVPVPAVPVPVTRPLVHRHGSFPYVPLRQVQAQPVRWADQTDGPVRSQSAVELAAAFRNRHSQPFDLRIRSTTNTA